MGEDSEPKAEEAAEKEKVNKKLPTIKTIVGILITGISLVISITSLVISNTSIKKSDVTIEIEVFKMIESSKTAFEEIDVDCDILEGKKGLGLLSPEEVIKLHVLRDRRNVAIESFLNAYELACAEYLDSKKWYSKKIDTGRFRKTYQSALRTIMKTPLFYEHINNPDNNYDAIKLVYDEGYG
jgi:hypothetical protein